MTEGRKGPFSRSALLVVPSPGTSFTSKAALPTGAHSSQQCHRMLATALCATLCRSLRPSRVLMHERLILPTLDPNDALDRNGQPNWNQEGSTALQLTNTFSYRCASPVCGVDHRLTVTPLAQTPPPHAATTSPSAPAGVHQ